MSLSTWDVPEITPAWLTTTLTAAGLEGKVTSYSEENASACMVREREASVWVAVVDSTPLHCGCSPRQSLGTLKRITAVFDDDTRVSFVLKRESASAGVFRSR
jgi:hypothetical protein